MTMGPLLAMAISDAYGAGFEFAPPAFIKKHNKMKGYVTHPKFTTRPDGAYTDDTQMTIGLVEHLLSDEPWTPRNLAHRWVHGYHRDPHTGYAQGFYDFLQVNGTGAQFLANIQPHSAKNGGAMRAFPCGYFPNPRDVRDMAMFQASLTHATYDGMRAAAAAALMFHFCYYKLGEKGSLGAFLAEWVPGTNWMEGLNPKGNPVEGIHTVQRALAVLLRSTSLADAIRTAVALGGDTDTVAAIVAPCVAVCDNMPNNVPAVLFGGLENGHYGRDYIQTLDEQLLAKYPPTLKVAPVQLALPVIASGLTVLKAIETAAGPLDFLFEDY